MPYVYNGVQEDEPMPATARIEMRVSEDHKQLVEQAASICGQTVTTFATTALVERAQLVLREHDRTMLTATDREAFLRILQDDQPNAALRNAAARFQKRHAHH
jgi:uncharacterized protein (DUF1778 family)